MTGFDVAGCPHRYHIRRVSFETSIYISDGAHQPAFGFGHAKMLWRRTDRDGTALVGSDKQYFFRGHNVKGVDPTGAGNCFGRSFASSFAQAAYLGDAAPTELSTFPKQQNEDVA